MLQLAELTNSFLVSEQRLEQAPKALPWSLSAMAGRLVEISADGGSAVLTAGFGLVLDAQREGETPAWISQCDSCFFPVDAHASGVDLDALVVVKAPDAVGAVRAADRLARSGAFGLIAIDLAAESKEGASAEVPDAAQSRLLGLARKHHIAIVFLTRKHAKAPSLSSLISLRAEPVRTKSLNRSLLKADFRSKFGAEFEVDIKIIKDKQRPPGRHQKELCHGPPGLR